MACACKGRVKMKFVWVPDGGTLESEGVMTYDSEIVAKAKVRRSGGQYVPEGQPLPVV